MYTNCDRVIKITIPAIRVAVAKRLKSDYGMNQSDIATRMGIAQAAVSKYLHNKSSQRISKLAGIIEREGMAEKIAGMAASKTNAKGVSSSIDELATSRPMIQKALPLLH